MPLGPSARHVTNYTEFAHLPCHIASSEHVGKAIMAVKRTHFGGAGERAAARPSEAQLCEDIRHFERQIARLASPASTWEQGALKCYQVLVQQRRRELDALRSGA